MSYRVQPPWMSSSQVARLLRISPGSLRRACHRGEVVPTFITPGGHWRFHRDEVIRFARTCLGQAPHPQP